LFQYGAGAWGNEDIKKQESGALGSRKSSEIKLYQEGKLEVMKGAQ